ncbi:sulfurtransferase complex subunit TusC [Kangiella sp. M94]
MNKSICIVFNKAPYGSQAGRELLDIALMAAAFDMPITAVFVKHGIYQLLKGQEPDILNIKNHSATFKALPLYGIEEVLVEQAAMQQFALTKDELIDIEDLKMVASDQIKTTISQSDFVLTL